jgi:hypothetical protein
MLFYDFHQRQLAVTAFSNKPLQESWKSNRRITSIPDLEDSLMVFQFFGYYFIDKSDPFPNLENAIRNLDDGKRSVTVDEVAVKISGQEFRFLQSIFQQHQLDNGIRVYAVRFDKAR